MRALVVVLEVLAWAVAVWLFVGLIGALRWLAPGADPGPGAFIAVALRLGGLALFVVALALTARRSARTEPQSLDALT